MLTSKSIPSYDLLVSLDRSDRTAALALFDFTTGTFLTEATLDLAPEALDAWFHRLRYFGWMHPSARKRRLLVEPLVLAVLYVRVRDPAAPIPWHRCCPHCGSFTLVVVATLPRAPP